MYNNVSPKGSWEEEVRSVWHAALSSLHALILGNAPVEEKEKVQILSLSTVRAVRGLEALISYKCGELPVTAQGHLVGQPIWLWTMKINRKCVLSSSEGIQKTQNPSSVWYPQSLTLFTRLCFKSPTSSTLSTGQEHGFQPLPPSSGYGNDLLMFLLKQGPWSSRLTPNEVWLAQNLQGCFCL